jgi:GT2 family glycosyltransferase
MSDIKVSIIIPSFNTKKILLDCLDSIIRYTNGIKYEIIIVENGSKDGSLQAIGEYCKKHKEAFLIDAKENLGFGRANNLAASRARGTYLLFLNSDTLLFDNAIKECIDTLNKRPDIGVYSCRLLNMDGSVQQTGGHFPNLLNVFAWQFFIDDLPIIGNMIPSFHPSKSQYDLDQKMDWVTGAFMIIPKKIFDDANGFDKNIFMYTEEMELAYRISKLGHATLLQKKPEIIHLGGASGGSFLALTSEVQNIIYFWKKHMPMWQLPFIKFSFFCGSLLRLLIFGIIKGDDTSRRAYVKALRLTF